MEGDAIVKRATKLLHIMYDERDKAADAKDLQRLVITGEIVNALALIIDPPNKKKKEERDQWMYTI